MSKAITFLLMMLIVNTICIGIMAGGGGIVATKLTATLGADNTTIVTANTSGFTNRGIIIISDEEIYHTGRTSLTFTGVTRGYNGTTKASHATGSYVYTEDASAVNNAMGFSIASTTDSMGMWAAPAIPFLFLFKTIPHALMSQDYSMFSSELAILSYFFLAIFAGIIITLAISLAGGRRVSV